MIDYQEQALRTEAANTIGVMERMAPAAREIHALLGLQTEVGELVDPFKKWVYYGRPVDFVNSREEIGDLLWYVAILCDCLGTTIDECQRVNIEKLRTRYPDKFTEDAAVFRDLNAERSALEAGR